MTFSDEIPPGIVRHIFEALGNCAFSEKRGDEYPVLCPFHDDKTPSCDINFEKKAWICWAGCGGGDVVDFVARVKCGGDNTRAIELIRDTFHIERVPAAAPTPTTAPRVTKTKRWEIRSATGELVAIHIREDYSDGTKEYPWERNGKRNLGGLPLAKLPLYAVDRLPADASLVLVAEGEKATDALLDAGFVAVGTVTGATSAPGPEPLEALRGRDVVLWPDNDKVGRGHMARIAERLAGLAASVRVLAWGEQPKDDAADFFARGGTAEQLDRMLAEATLYTPESQQPEAPSVEYGVQMICAIDVVERPIEWLWPQRIPRRYPTFISGNPGEGKSHLGIDITARVTTASLWPDGGRAPLGAVLILSSEDGREDVLRPRLRVAGAELRHVGFITGKTKPGQGGTKFLVNLKDDLATIEAAMPRWKEALGLPAILLLIDPFMNHLGARRMEDLEIRPILSELSEFAQRTDVTPVGIRHLNKDEGKSLIYRGSGTMAFSGVARAEFFVGVNPEDESERVFARVKGNLSREPGSLLYTIEDSSPGSGISILRWRGPTDLRAEDVLPTGRDKVDSGHSAPQQTRAEQMILGLLGEGRDVPPEEIFKKADELDIGKKSVYAAAKKLGVIKRPPSFGGPWTWSLTVDTQ